MSQTDHAEPLQPEPQEEEYTEPPRPRWKRRLTIIAILLVMVLIAAEVLTSYYLSWKLRQTVSTKLDARLQLGLVIYVPPYGVIVFNPELNRDSHKIFEASRIKLSLGKFPRRDEPVVISSLRMSAPI